MIYKASFTIEADDIESAGAMFASILPSYVVGTIEPAEPFTITVTGAV